MSQATTKNPTAIVVINMTIPTRRLVACAVIASALLGTGCETTTSQRTKSAGSSQIAQATKPLEGFDTPVDNPKAGNAKAGGQIAASKETVIPFFDPQARARADVQFNDKTYLAHQRKDLPKQTPNTLIPTKSVEQTQGVSKQSQPKDEDVFTPTLTGIDSAKADTLTTQPAPTTRGTILAEAQKALADSTEPAWQKAVDRVVLSAAQGNSEPSAEILDGLTGKQQIQLKAYHQLLLQLNNDLAYQTSAFDPAAILAKGSSLADDEGYVKITDLQLCSSVRGFGQYQKLKTERLLAGRPQPMVIYTALDGFESKLLTNGEYETRVSQEVKLYHEADDLIVWEQPAQLLADTSFKRRRDFFLVQTVSLPSNLGPGSYLLKITIVDHHSNTMWEESKTLDVVTQESLITTTAKADNGGWGDSPSN